MGFTAAVAHPGRSAATLVRPTTTMKTLHNVRWLAVFAIASALLVGCATVSLPPARGYDVQIANTRYWAKTVKFHGPWVELDTESGQVWANRNSVVTIQPKN